LIGGIHPLTGGLAADGIQMDTAIQMAIEELNAAGGVLGSSSISRPTRPARLKWARLRLNV
jgi:ABC-type branched-subunit amino acid transport system substrate-binding protein